MPKNKEVEVWLARYENPMKDVVLSVRDIVLGADPRIAECIKWQAPTFTFEGKRCSAPRQRGSGSAPFLASSAMRRRRSLALKRGRDSSWRRLDTWFTPKPAEIVAEPDDA